MDVNDLVISSIHNYKFSLIHINTNYVVQGTVTQSTDVIQEMHKNTILHNFH